jgi:hypothetical protein
MNPPGFLPDELYKFFLSKAGVPPVEINLVQSSGKFNGGIAALGRTNGRPDNCPRVGTSGKKCPSGTRLFFQLSYSPQYIFNKGKVLWIPFFYHFVIFGLFQCGSA